MINENDVINAVCKRLKELKFQINQSLHTSEKGIDIIAEREDFTLFIEAKGGTSSKETTRRFGKPFNIGQVKNHIGKALLATVKQLSIIQESSNMGVAIALPDTSDHRRIIEEISYVLKKINIIVFWVKDNLSVDIDLNNSNNQPIR